MNDSEFEGLLTSIARDSVEWMAFVRKMSEQFAADKKALLSRMEERTAAYEANEVKLYDKIHLLEGEVAGRDEEYDKVWHKKEDALHNVGMLVGVIEEIVNHIAKGTVTFSPECVAGYRQLIQRFKDIEARRNKVSKMHGEVVPVSSLSKELQEAIGNQTEPEGDPVFTPITFYENRFYPFSNFSAFKVWYDNQLWDTSEHAYQAAKFNPVEGKEQYDIYAFIRDGVRSAHEAMKLAQRNKNFQRAGWDDIKRDVMKDICRAKMQQHEYVRGKLIESGHRPLIESSPIDSFWGWGPNKDGRNELGKIWMELREEFTDTTLLGLVTKDKALKQIPPPHENT